MNRHPKRRVQETWTPPGFLFKDLQPEIFLPTLKTFKNIVTEFIQETIKRFRTEDREDYFKYLW